MRYGASGAVLCVIGMGIIGCEAKDPDDSAVKLGSGGASTSRSGGSQSSNIGGQGDLGGAGSGGTRSAVGGSGTGGLLGSGGLVSGGLASGGLASGGLASGGLGSGGGDPTGGTSGSLPQWMISGGTCNIESPTPQCVCPSCAILGSEKLTGTCQDLVLCYENKCTITGPGIEGSLSCTPPDACDSVLEGKGFDLTTTTNVKRTAYLNYRCKDFDVGVKSN